MPSACGIGRRHLWSGPVAAAVALWGASPPEAEAFRNDRILNSKKTLVPQIRSAYQKLEGLRDDLYLQVELEQGNANSRVTYEARPADWYSGLDSNLDGFLVLANDPSGFGCEEYPDKLKGIVLVPRGRCSFATKVSLAKAAGAKSVVVYDQKMSRQPLETQGKVGAVRSKGIAARSAGDALTGGVYLVAVERGVTIMGPESDAAPRPDLDGAMISLTNGTDLVQAVQAGTSPRILDVKRFEFSRGIDAFIQKDLKPMLTRMESYGNAQRISKDDMNDPVLRTLKKDRDKFAAAVRAKDYGEIRRTFAEWNKNLDVIGRWDLAETY